MASELLVCTKLQPGWVSNKPVPSCSWCTFWSAPHFS